MGGGRENAVCQRAFGALASVGRGRCGKIEDVAAQTFLSCALGRAQPDGVCPGLDYRLRAHHRGPERSRPAYGEGANVLSKRQRLSFGLRAFGRRFSLTLPGRGGRHAPRASAKRICRMAAAVPAADFQKWIWRLAATGEVYG